MVKEKILKDKNSHKILEHGTDQKLKTLSLIF